MDGMETSSSISLAMEGRKKICEMIQNTIDLPFEVQSNYLFEFNIPDIVIRKCNLSHRKNIYPGHAGLASFPINIKQRTTLTILHPGHTSTPTARASSCSLYR